MLSDAPVLHMFCGKIASGKSTLAASLGAAPRTVVVAEDGWLSALYGPEMATVGDYVDRSARLRAVMGPHVSGLLNAGISVVLDFPANTRETRDWMRQILSQTQADHQMHVFDVTDAVCLARMHARAAQNDHPFEVSEAQFHQISKHFVPPSAEEGFRIVRHEA